MPREKTHFRVIPKNLIEVLGLKVFFLEGGMLNSEGAFVRVESTRRGGDVARRKLRIRWSV